MHYSTSLIDTKTVKDSILHPLKVKISTDNQLAEIITYAIFMVGLPKENVPGSHHMDLLIAFIRENYLNYSLAEMKYAFTMAAKGELNTDCKHYGSFSPEYFGRIMKAYSEQHRLKINAELAKQINALPQPEEPSEIEKVRIRKDFESNVIVPMFKNYIENGKIETGYTPIKLIYQNLVEFHRIIDFDLEQKQVIHKQAIKNIDLGIQFKSNNGIFEANKNKIFNAIHEHMNETQRTVNSVQEECYFICVNEVFEKLKHENLDLKNVLNCEI
ncbi:hypothetical protein [uncultured phage]|nr:hypothetical protein [uncultured phage]